MFRYLYYFENDNPIIQVRYLSGLIALINEQSAGSVSVANPAVEAHYKNILGSNCQIFKIYYAYQTFTN
jgi:hypothetical protein